VVLILVLILWSCYLVVCRVEAWEPEMYLFDVDDYIFSFMSDLEGVGRRVGGVAAWSPGSVWCAFWSIRTILCQLFSQFESLLKN
jgi:hypothetical protein